MQNLAPQMQPMPSRGSSPGPAPTQVLTFRKSPRDKKITLIQPFNAAPNAPPYYSVRHSKNHKPQVVLFQGDASAHNSIGEASISSISSKIKASLRGHHFIIKESNLSGNFTIMDPQRGDLKWHTDFLLGRALELRDLQGMVLAKLKTQGFPGSKQKKLEIYVPHDNNFLDLVVLTGFVAKSAEKADADGLVEVAGAVAGV